VADPHRNLIGPVNGLVWGFVRSMLDLPDGEYLDWLLI
jgi:hypothetical protein